MKRCPQCNFIYLDNDDVCDLDQTQLVFMDEGEIDSHWDGASHQKIDGAHSGVTQPESSRNRKPLIAVALSGVGIALILLVVYSASKSRRLERSAAENANSTAVAIVGGNAAMITPRTSESGSPSPGSPSPSAKPTPQLRNTQTRGTVSSAPVSTSATDAARSGSVTIRLTNGSRIPADEVWRTKDGIWYRRNGIVTLLKRSQVRGIERGP